MMKESNSRRSFFKKVAAVAGVVATAGYTGNLVSASSGRAGEERAKYAEDNALQQEAMSQKQFVLMTDDEKKQMLEEILNNHYKERA